jgi:hypothetical protein
MNRLVRRVDAEFDEMPGLRLTREQARRLWNLTEHDCDEALRQLCDSGRLACDAAGRYLRQRFDY